ncbi:hypothetical protein NQ318_009009 [Aromia moschata]|uniref:Uncharacterized protein n=1 Tax=Aromia moschata TaxID=1265417 RepID=A0AAV8YTY8_9CUCU|nr:hypothetical protein NQ318_009009 [Aromia moschata]
MALFAGLAILHCVSGIIFTDVVTDLVKYYGRTTMVTEFSCKRNESISLLKTLMKNGHQTKIMTINSLNIGYPVPPNHQVFALNLDCTNSSILLKRVNELKLFTSPFRWILYYTQSETILKSYFLDLDLLVDSDVTLCKLLENKTVLMTKIYKILSNYSMQTEEMGFWTKDGVIVNYNFEKNIARRRKNLDGIELNTCIVITNKDSLNHLTDRRDKHIDSIAKVNYVLVEHLKDIINATLNYSVQETWGYKDNNSEWNGMIGELMRNEADIGGTPLFFTSDRVDIIDYIAMTTPTRSKFVFRQPKLSYVTNVFTLPFDTNVWISTVCLVIIGAFVLHLIIMWEWKKWKMYGRSNNQSAVPEVKNSIIDTAFFTFGAVCQQGSSYIPFSIPGRITAIMLYVSLMFLYTSYSANIVALLQSSSDSIQTLEDLLKSRLQIGVDDTVFNRFYFPNSADPIRRQIYLQKVAPKGKKDHFMPIEEGIRKMRKGLFAFHMATGPGYKIVSDTFQEEEKCGLKEIQFLQVIDPCLHRIQESGIQAREVGLIYTKKPDCTSRGTSFISVGIIDCYLAIVILAGGMMAALLVFLIEIYLYNR